MKRRRPAASSPPPLDPRKAEALTLAMAVAPGVYVRNRMFALFTHPGVQRARARAATLRGVLRQLARAEEVALTAAGPGQWRLGYRIARMRMSRVVELTDAELSALRVLAERATLAVAPVLVARDEDRERVDAVLSHLLDESGPIRFEPPSTEP